MSPRHVAAAVSLAVAGALLAVLPAAAHTPVDGWVDQPVTVARDGHLPASIVTDVPPGGTSMITTPELSPDVKTLKVTVKPKSPVGEEDFDQFFTTINTMPKSKRLLACTMMYQLALNPADIGSETRTFTATNIVFAGALLTTCLELAGLLQSGPVAQPRTTSRAGSRCGLSAPAVPMKVTHDASGYHVTASGTPAKFKKTQLKVMCKQTGSTLTITIRSAKRGQSLRQAVGKHLSIGLKSPTGAQSTVPVSVTFARG